MLTIDPARHTLGHRLWAVWLAMLGLAGAWQFAAVPPALLRSHWFSTLAWLFTLACCGVAAEAFWSGRRYRHGAAQGVLWGQLLIWGKLLFTHATEMPRGVPLIVILPLTLSAFLLVINSADRPSAKNRSRP